MPVRLRGQVAWRPRKQPTRRPRRSKQLQKEKTMFDITVREDLADFGRRAESAVENILGAHAQEGAWCDRLRAWLADCSRAPHRALRTSVIEQAVGDLVTLNTACQGYAAVDGGLSLTDRGGSLFARRALAELLVLVSRHDPKLARELAGKAQAQRDTNLRRMSDLIAARA